MKDVLPPVESLYPLFWKLLHALVYLAGAAALTVLIHWSFTRFHGFTDQLRRDRGSAANVEFEKQSATITTTVRRFLVMLVWTMAVILALRELNFDVGPLLAGAGVAGLAVGFAAQNLLKDVLNGLFLLAEGHIRINDVVRIDNISGTVEELSLRTTVLRGLDGAAHVFSNGTISNFTNLTRSYAYHVIDLPVDFAVNPEQVAGILRAVSGELGKDPELQGLILEPVEVFGIDRFTEQGVVIKARIKTLPNQQWKVGREFNRRLKAALDGAGIEVATASRQVTYTRFDGEQRDAIKSVVEEVLRERNGGPAAAQS